MRTQGWEIYMTELLPIILVAMGFAVLAEMQSRKDPFRQKYRRKDVLFCLCMFLVLAVFAGLRTRYNDTRTYTRSYELLAANGSVFDGIHWSLSASVGFELTQRVMRVAGASTQTFLMLFALFDVGVNIWFIRKYSDSLWRSFFLYIVMGCYMFNMAAIMQCTATALALIGVDRYLQKKNFQFVLFILLAATFHTYAIMFILLPLLDFKPWTKKTYWMLGVFLIVGLFLPRLLGIVVSVTSAMGESYSLDSFTEAGVNIFRFLTVSVPVVLSFIARKRIARSSSRVDCVILNLTMLNAEIMFVGLFGTANYFARLANYFLMFQTISLPWLFRFFNKSEQRMLTVGMVLCYSLYFYYQNGIVLPFDGLFNRADLLDYLSSLTG